jgi:deoxyribose-phosphate aldolase
MSNEKQQQKSSPKKKRVKEGAGEIDLVYAVYV